MSPAVINDQAYVTLATNDAYGQGAMVLAQSLRNSGTTRMLVCMVTPGVSQTMRTNLLMFFDMITQVDVFDSRDTANLALLNRPDLGVTFTKLHCWRLAQFSKCAFLDADTVVLQNIDDLFDREELSAAPDAGWPDCFNSGLFVFRPSNETYNALVQYAVTHGSFDGGDQGLLNSFFHDWATKDITKRLPFIYNVVSTAFYSYLPAFKQFGKNVKVAHFIGGVKPWHYTYNTTTGKVDCTGAEAEFIQIWWNVYTRDVESKLSSTSASGAGAQGTAYSKPVLGDKRRMYSWEKGQIDYMGIDSFSNIQSHLDTSTGK